MRTCDERVRSCKDSRRHYIAGFATRQLWIGAFAHELPRRWRTVDPEEFEVVAVALAPMQATVQWCARSSPTARAKRHQMGAQVRRGERTVLCAHFERTASGHQNDSDMDAGGNGESHGEGEGGAGDSADSGNGRNGRDTGRSSGLHCMPLWLFYVAQIEGLSRSTPHELQQRKAWADRSPIDGAMRFIGGYRANIEHGDRHAAYSPNADRILMPDIDRFNSPEDYCAAALHELAHWTGSEMRLKRSSGQGFGEAAYAFEELVEQFGCAFVLGHIGLVHATIEGHAAYLGNWLQVLRTAIFIAARHAGESYEFRLARELPLPDSVG